MLNLHIAEIRTIVATKRVGLMNGAKAYAGCVVVIFENDQRLGFDYLSHLSPFWF